MAKKAANKPGPPRRSWVPIRASNKQPIPHSWIIREAPPNEPVEVTVRVRRRRPLGDPAATGILSREQYERNHGADPADVRAVEDYPAYCIKPSKKDRRSRPKLIRLLLFTQ